MYQSFILWLVLPFLLPTSNRVDFHSGSFESALARAKAQDKNIIVTLSATWCTPCKMMDEHTFSNDEVQKQLQNDFVAVKYDIDTEEGMQFAIAQDCKSLPTLYVFHPDGTKLEEIKHAVMPTEMMNLLSQHAEVTEEPVVVKKPGLFKRIFGKKDRNNESA